MLPSAWSISCPPARVAWWKASSSILHRDSMSDSLSLIIFSLLFIIKIKRSISSDKRKSCSRKAWTGQLLY